MIMRSLGGTGDHEVIGVLVIMGSLGGTGDHVVIGGHW